MIPVSPSSKSGNFEIIHALKPDKSSFYHYKLTAFLFGENFQNIDEKYFLEWCSLCKLLIAISNIANGD